MPILPGIRVIVRRFLCIERRFLSNSSKKFYVDVLAQCALHLYSRTQLTASATIYPFLKTITYVCTRLREDGHLRM